MPKNVKSVLAAALCGASALAALPAEALAGPMSAAHPTSVGLITSVEKAYYRGYRRGYYSGYGGYYRRGYGVPGAAVGAAAGVAGAAAGLVGAGIAGASGLWLSRLWLWQRVWRQLVLGVGPGRRLGVGLQIKRAPRPVRHLRARPRQLPVVAFAE
jgi:hypothetical protein